ncbi:MAG: hypothetical protein ACJAXK_001248 [Yoonia sp.]|jgi:hypothetical protein
MGEANTDFCVVQTCLYLPNLARCLKKMRWPNLLKKSLSATQRKAVCSLMTGMRTDIDFAHYLPFSDTCCCKALGLNFRCKPAVFSVDRPQAIIFAKAKQHDK